MKSNLIDVDFNPVNRPSFGDSFPSEGRGVKELTLDEINEIHGGVAPLVIIGGALLLGAGVGLLASWIAY